MVGNNPCANDADGGKKPEYVEAKILNNETEVGSKKDSGEMEELTMGLGSMKLDPTRGLGLGDVSDKLAGLKVTEKEEEDEEADSDEEGVTVRWDDIEDEKLISRGPPGVPVAAGSSSQPSYAPAMIKQTGGQMKRSFDEGPDPFSKGFRPATHLSGGSVRPNKPLTVAQLLNQKEQEQRARLEQELQAQQWNCFAQMTAPPQHPSAVQNYNIPPEPVNLQNPNEEIDVDAILQLIEESEAQTQQPQPPQTSPQPPVQTAGEIQPNVVLRERTTSVNPATPDTGYDSALSPGSVQSDKSSRRSSQEQELEWEIIEEFLEAQGYRTEEEVQRVPPANRVSPPAKNTTPRQSPTMIAATTATTVAAPRPKKSALIAPNQQPLFVAVIPSSLPAQKPMMGAGRSTSKGTATRTRPILPRPPEPVGQLQSQPGPTQNIPSAVVAPTAPVVPSSRKPPATNPSVPEAKKYPPLKPAPQRDAPLVPHVLPDVLTDSKAKFGAHRTVAGEPLSKILQSDDDGDTWLHSYILHLREEWKSLYMINAILSRLKREHSEHKIDIKQVINTQNNNYQTPVYLATVINNQWVLDWLLKAGGDPNILATSNTPSGPLRKAPLHYAASRGDECLDVLSVLLDCRKTDLNIKNTDGLTPLHVAIQSHGKPNPKPPSSSNGSREKPAGTSAQHASVIDSTRVIQVLIGRGANLEEVDDKNGKTPVHNLVETHCYDLINNIFNVIPDPDLKKYLRMQTFGGNTALHIAAQSVMSNIDEHKKIIKLLLDKGADPAMKNSENNTASQIAYKPHRDELTPLLKSHSKSYQNAASPQGANNCQMGPTRLAPRKPTTTAAVNGNAPVVFVQALPATTQMVPIQAVPAPMNSQTMMVTTNASICSGSSPLAKTAMQNSGAPGMVQATQALYTSPLNSPQMLPMRSPQVAQSPPHVHSPQMAQACHDVAGTAGVNTQQTLVGQTYQPGTGVSPSYGQPVQPVQATSRC